MHLLKFASVLIVEANTIQEIVQPAPYFENTKILCTSVEPKDLEVGKVKVSIIINQSTRQSNTYLSHKELRMLQK